MVDARQPTTSALWWHLFVGKNENLGANVTSVFGESTMHPDKVAETAKTFEPPLHHVTSFDHEPDDEETAAAILNELVDMLEGL